MTYEPSPEILALIDHGPIADAVFEIQTANARFQAVADQARDAEAALKQARAALPALLQGAIEGEKVSDKAIAAIHRRIEDAERICDFRKEIARRLWPSQIEADARLSAARAKAFAAVLDHGIDLQIKAAECGDEAAGSPDRLPDLPALAAAKRDFEDASRLIVYAIQSGAKHAGASHRPLWQTHSSIVRQIWGRAPVEQEIAA